VGVRVRAGRQEGFAGADMSMLVISGKAKNDTDVVSVHAAVEFECDWSARHLGRLRSFAASEGFSLRTPNRLSGF
jgi:hypothetical protein